MLLGFEISIHGHQPAHRRRVAAAAHEPVFQASISACRHLFAIVVAGSLASAAAAAEFGFEGLTITVPDGVVVERAAGPPLVDRPVSVALDEQGRLYVAESSGSSAPLAKQLADPQHKVVRLEDVDGDGVFDRRTVFADKLMMLQGTQWHRGSLFVAAPPTIWKLTDTDDDGVADERVEWFTAGLGGCGNEVHGPYLGRDGRLYWCKGEFQLQTHDLPGRPGWKTSAAHIFRARPDGSDREMVMTGGMNNPVELAFTPAGERILSATFISNDRGGGRDGLIHALYGGVYGREHGVLNGHERTGDLLPPLLSMGPAAPCGTQLVASGSGLGADAVGNLFVCAFNLRTVFRTALTPAGGTFTAHCTPFLTGDSADFHPTDVHEDADGSLLVVDTGGWYKICCPTSRAHVPQVLGAIYRVRRGDAAAVEDPRGLALDWPTLAADELCRLLADPRPAVAERAGDTLARTGLPAVAPLRQFLATCPAAFARQHAVWTLAKIEGPEPRAAVRMALGDQAAEVRHAAAHGAGLHRDESAVAGLAALIRGDDAAAARAAAEAIGRIGSVAAVEAVLAAMPAATSRALEHSLTYALIESARPEPLLAALDSPEPRVVRAALYGLDQMAPRLPAAVLSQDRVIPLCGSTEPFVRDAAWWVVSQHPAWAESLVGSLQGQLQRAAAAGPEEADRIISLVARITSQPAAADAIAELSTGGGDAGAAVRRLALTVMRTARPAATPQSWVDGLADTLQRPITEREADDVTAALHTLADLSLSEPQRAKIRPAALAIAGDPRCSPRGCALALQVAGTAAGPLPPAVAERLIGMLAAGVEAGFSPLDRSAAARALAATASDDGQLERIAATFDRLLGNEIAVLLPAFTSKRGNLLVAAVEALGRNAKPEAVDRDTVAAAVNALPPPNLQAGQALLARIDTARAAERESYATLAASLPAGDANRGRAVFASSKAACTSCHALGGAGGRIGPDLTAIGAIRRPADLLEAIVLPSAAFVRTYEPVTVVTVEGRVLSGIIRDETAADVILQTSATAAERIPRAKVESLHPGTISLMPKGYDTLLSPQELADLVAYLAAAK